MKSRKISLLGEDETNPTNTYGETKLAMEKMMKWFDLALWSKVCFFKIF
jgi:UDP-glucose 4-epimerase